MFSPTPGPILSPNLAEENRQSSTFVLRRQVVFCDNCSLSMEMWSTMILIDNSHDSMKAVSELEEFFEAETERQTKASTWWIDTVEAGYYYLLVCFSSFECRFVWVGWIFRERRMNQSAVRIISLLVSYRQIKNVPGFQTK